MLNKIKNLFKKPEPPKPEPVAEKPKKPKQPKKQKEVTLSEKEKATQQGEPYIAILKVEVSPDDLGNGSFELDWNDKFVVNLVKQGYKIKQTDTDAEIVDRWFQTVCRNIALEIYEQDQADPSNRDMISDMRVIRSRDIGNGRSEVS
jgi:hypothetical protein